ncbi:hypothetical protein HDU76_010307 [Blyttiomyces sp. JEL0837]|nr:hypothetical protein HDU76_010307 [Blyttiomyces sp. JEL0837]
MAASKTMEVMYIAVECKVRASVSSNGPKLHPQISPFPEVDPTLNAYDRPAVLKAKDAYFLETSVVTAEIVTLRDKMRWCYRREGVNHLQNCRHLTQQYLDLIREAGVQWVKPFNVPTPASAVASE